MEEQKMRIPFAGIVIGDTLYWVCIIGALIALIGPVVSLLAPANNMADPFKIFSLVWEGKSSGEIWAAVTAAGQYPGPLFWMHDLSKGDAITQLGVWLACSCSLPAALFGGIVYLFGLGGARRSVTYFIICMFVAFMILYAMLI
ncbi:MAG: hypothetical protein JRI35_06045 [Deltaproteobacteria bacterium]|nr:hypothetical protein [Deltaproteobacteria bacterium]MBW1946991.1 hypothetical protein [Deltaproteobacteria bacterium]MBW1966124.1 hypothetical protein [Deltaproteobacteria bacterium]